MQNYKINIHTLPQRSASKPLTKGVVANKWFDVPIFDHITLDGHGKRIDRSSTIYMASLHELYE